MGVTTWSEEEDDFLRRLAASNVSSADIAVQLAEIFGSTRSRSSVCGRASRLGVTLNSVGPGSHAAVKVARQSRAKTPRPAGERRPPSPSRTALQAEQRAAEEQARAAELAAIEATLAEQAAEPNPGVLFLERVMSKQCAWPLPGWDALPITEKRVCGRPVVVRRIVCDGVASFVPTSWCLSCQARAVQASNGRRRDIYTLSGVSRRAA